MMPSVWRKAVKTAINDRLIVRRAFEADAPALASIMAEAIDWGRMRQLGHRFNTMVHRHMAKSEYAITYVAECNGEILGYAAGATDVSKFYREFLWRYGVPASLTLLPKVIRPSMLTAVIRGLTYFPDAYPDDPKAEMISLAVRRHITRSGVGQAVMAAATKELKAWGITTVKFGTVAVNNVAANKYYARMGAVIVRTVPFYKDSTVNVYIYQIP